MDIKISEFPILNVGIASNAVIPIVQNNTNYTLGVSVSAANNSVPMRNSLGGVSVISVDWYNNFNESYGKLKIDELSIDQNWILPDKSGTVVVSDPITNNVRVDGNLQVNGLPQFASHGVADTQLFLQVGALYTLMGSRAVYAMPNPFS